MFRRKRGKYDNLGIVDPSNTKSVVAEQYRTVRTNIQFSMIDSDLKSFLVTSAAPNAGKSFSAANLATTFAYDDKRVLLVDTDLRKPTVHKVFQTRNTSGLTTLLTDKTKTFKDAIQRTSVDNLFVLPSGPIPPNPSEMIGSARMDQLIKELEDEFDLVIFDTPPLSAVTDAQILSTKTDGVVFIIYQNRAIKEEVIQAKELLEKVNANIIGAILNGVEPNGDNYYYYT